MFAFADIKNRVTRTRNAFFKMRRNPMGIQKEELLNLNEGPSEEVPFVGLSQKNTSQKKGGRRGVLGRQFGGRRRVKENREVTVQHEKKVVCPAVVAEDVGLSKQNATPISSAGADALAVQVRVRQIQNPPATRKWGAIPTLRSQLRLCIG